MFFNNPSVVSCTIVFIVSSYALSTTSFAQTDTSKSLARADSLVTDVVEVKNGDRLTGKIIKIFRGELYFDGNETGDVRIDLKQISFLMGRSKSFIIESVDNQRLIGKIERASTTGNVLIKSLSDSIVLKIDEIIILNGFESKLIERIDGNVNLGYSFTKSSDITRFNLSNELSYTAEKWRTIQSFSSIYTIGDGDGIERINADLTTIYTLQKRWLALGDFQFQRMLELGVASRVIGIVGAGRKLIQNKNIGLIAGTGISAQRESSVDGSVSNVEAELPILIRLNLFQLKKPDITVSSSLNYYYSLSVSKRFRVDYKIDFNYEVVKNLLVGFQFFYNYDSKPLAENISYNDFGNVLTVGYKF